MNKHLRGESIQATLFDVVGAATPREYPRGMRSKDFLRHCASQFQTVEIDSTFYGTPSASTVTSWNEKTRRGLSGGQHDC